MPGSVAGSAAPAAAAATGCRWHPRGDAGTACGRAGVCGGYRAEGGRSLLLLLASQPGRRQVPSLGAGGLAQPRSAHQCRASRAPAGGARYAYTSAREACGRSRPSTGGPHGLCARLMQPAACEAAESLPHCPARRPTSAHRWPASIARRASLEQRGTRSKARAESCTQLAVLHPSTLAQRGLVQAYLLPGAWNRSAQPRLGRGRLTGRQGSGRVGPQGRGMLRRCLREARRLLPQSAHTQAGLPHQPARRGLPAC